MRYTGTETPIAVGILPAGGTVNVQAANQNTGALLTLTSASAVQLPITADANGRTAWQWDLTNIQDVIQGFAQIIVAFTHQDSGERDYCKICVRGVMDEISQTRRLVSTLV